MTRPEIEERVAKLEDLVAAMVEETRTKRLVVDAGEVRIVVGTDSGGDTGVHVRAGEVRAALVANVGDDEIEYAGVEMWGGGGLQANAHVLHFAADKEYVPGTVGLGTEAQGREIDHLRTLLRAIGAVMTASTAPELHDAAAES